MRQTILFVTLDEIFAAEESKLAECVASLILPRVSEINKPGFLVVGSLNSEMSVRDEKTGW